MTSHAFHKASKESGREFPARAPHQVFSRITAQMTVGGSRQLHYSLSSVQVGSVQDDSAMTIYCEIGAELAAVPTCSESYDAALT